MTDARAHVALLVDFANLRQQLAPEEGAVDTGPEGRAIARSLVAYAAGIGRIGVARAYADWSREPELSRQLNGTRLSPILVPATEDGEDRSHIRLAVDAMEVLYNGDDPDAFVLVSSDASLVPLVQALRADGSEIIVIAADGASAEELCAEADQVATLEDVLAGAVGEPLVLRPVRDRAERSGEGEAKPAQGEKKKPLRPLLTDSNFEDYNWSGFVELIDDLEQRLPFVGVRYLVNKVLGPHNCGIQDPRIKRDLINEAVDEGLIEMYTVGNVNDRTDPVTACRLDRHSEVVQQYLADREDDLDEDALDGDALDADDQGPEVEANEVSTEPVRS